MTDKIARVMGADGSVYEVKIVDTLTFDPDTGKPIFRQGVDAQRSAIQVAPADQVTTDPFTDVAGSLLDTLNNLAVSYTLVNIGANTLCWQVLGANQAGFADVQIVQASADVLAAGIASYSAATALWRYYKVQVKSKVAGNTGTAQVRGVTKG